MKTQAKPTKKTSILKFVAFLLLCAVFGGILGYFSVDFADRIPDLMSALNSGLQSVSVWLLFASVPFNLAAILFYLKGNNFANRAAQDDDAFEEANRLLSISLMITSSTLCWVIIFSGIAISSLFHSENILFGLISTVFLILEIVFNSILQGKVIKITKQLAPEKRGNILDANFQKDWYNSCDEAEQKAIGDYSYFTFRIMNAVYPILLSVIIIFSITYSVNSFVVIVIGGLWMLQNMTYMGRSYWMEYRKK